jgi:hypothetical protein
MLKVYTKIALLTLILAFSFTLAFSTTVVLKDGTVLNGTIVEASDDSIVIETSLGPIEVPQDRIQEILADGKSRTEAELEPTSDNVTPNIVIQTQAQDNDDLDRETAEREKEIEEKKIKLYFMLHDKQFRDKMGIYEMQRVAGDIAFSDRLAMYAAFERRDQGMGAGLNFLIPSLGSWMQGDVFGALLQNGLTLVGGGLILWHQTYDYDNSTFYSEEKGQSDMMLYAGVTVLVANWVFGIIRPFTYVKKWNKQIATSLRISVQKGYGPSPYESYSGYSGKKRDAQIGVELLSVEY